MDIKEDKTELRKKWVYRSLGKEYQRVQEEEDVFSYLDCIYSYM